MGRLFESGRLLDHLQYPGMIDLIVTLLFRWRGIEAFSPYSKSLFQEIFTCFQYGKYGSE